MIEIAALGFLTGCISATLILCFIKWGWLEWFEIHWRPICKFCLGFWLCIIQTILIFIFFNQNIFDIAIPFAGASICRELIQ